ncbi:Fructose-1,6-bisphosphatase class 2 [Candidatus Thermoflexus japonica]|uniref:Fructose-1,6-bisphosphatase n=1 Tax=Candidatus Thermoflexus japonica TaxID=2035417 RepID=A0A2H5Y5S3_9CHLR|nr:Fructose-1,6-bisphosphatase class 2 [Candidatus Thermoflexus japonica]
MPQEPDRNLALELVRVTEAAALAAGRWMGRGDRNAADRAAVEAMRLMLRSIDMDGIVVIGEGEKDEAPMLYNGERIGNGRPPQVDVAVDPIDGTRLLALGRPGAIAVVALSERGTMFSPGRIVYMNKLAVGPEAREAIDLDAPIAENLQRIARAKGKDVDDLTVVILERDRHADLIREVRAAGARIKLITDGDVSAALMTAFPDSGIDVLVGIGGSPEAVITAAALKCLGGEIHARLWPRNEEERRFAAEMGYDLQRILTADDLVRGDNIFFAATGITDGEILRGVRYTGDGARTHSVVMRSRSGTIRFVEAYHRWDKLMRISGYPYDQRAGGAPPPAR